MVTSTRPAIQSGVQDLRLHFRCEFRVSREASDQPPFEEMITLAQRWVISKNKGNSKGLSGRWFQQNGQWIAPGESRIRIEVDSATRGKPPVCFWALRYEHPDSSIQPGAGFRQWRTDLSLSTAANSVILSMQVAHYLLPKHFGPEPDVPRPTSPFLVKNIFRSPGLLTHAGAQPLTAHPLEVTADDASILVERIEDPNRQCPLIYVSREFNTGDPVINPEHLAWSVAGLATVYVAESTWLDKATEQILPSDYRCWNGRVRVYMPTVRLDRPQDSKRHRYFTPEQIRAGGAQEIERIIVQSLARRVALSSVAPVLNVDDVRLKRREESFNRLKQQLDSAPPAEMLELLESINKDLGQKLQTAEARQRSLEGQLEYAQLELGEKEDDLRVSRYQEKELRTAAMVEQERIAAEARDGILAKLATLPESVEACCCFFAENYSERMIFTPRAIESARRADFPRVDAVWEALWHVANTLYPLVFSRNSSCGDLEDEFRHRSGIKLALSEGKLTKANNKLMQLRFQDYEGEKINVTPHIKLQAGNKHLRIHFHIHKARQRVIVGHCGDHLDTAGTAKRK